MKYLNTLITLFLTTALTGIVRADNSLAQPQMRSNADLFYFTPDEAWMALQQFGPDGENAPSLNHIFGSDVPPAIQRQVMEDLAFIGSIHGTGASPYHQQIFGAGPISGPNYTRFFAERVRGIGMDDCGNPIAIACVIPTRHPNIMWLTPNFVKFNQPQIFRLMILFHEARHTESRNGNWLHAFCPPDYPRRSLLTGAPLANEPACDVTPFGSYGSSTIMMANIAMNCPDPACNSKVREDAAFYAADHLERVIDQRARRDMEIDLDPARAGTLW